ncbi:hypothetical protein Tco_1439947 [Tanacetum coccineum]
MVSRTLYVSTILTDLDHVVLLKYKINGDSPPPKRIVDGVEQTYPPATAEEKLARKNELKARGNKESKKTQKTLLKQQYDNFNISSSEGLDQTYDRQHLNKEQITIELSLRMLRQKGKACPLLLLAKKQSRTVAKIVNGERKIQDLVDKKKVIITETSIRSDLKLDDDEGIDCLPTATIFTELERIGLQEKVLDLDKAKTTQAKEIDSLKKRVKQLEKRRKLRTPGRKRLRKIGSNSRVESSNDVSLDNQEDASKQRRRIEDLEADAEVTLVDETQEMTDDNLMFKKEVVEKEVSAADPVTTAGEVVTTANVLTTTIDELTLAQTLIEIKAAKPKAVTSAATTTTTTRPKARGVVVQETSEFKTTSSTLQASQLIQAKDKVKAIMVEPERPLMKKDQVALDEEMARNLEA